MVCTELYKCGGEGDIFMNITPPMIGEDLEDDENNDNYEHLIRNVDTSDSYCIFV